jgi:plastin-3
MFDDKQESDVRHRAELMLGEANKIGCRQFVSPDDVVNGNYKLNLAFVANLFNNHPGLESTGEIDLEQMQLHQETREEKS